MDIENKNEILDNPLVVHNKNDASYKDSSESIEMEETLVMDNDDTLTRHRFKKDDTKRSKKPLFFALIVVIAAVVFCALYFSGNISFGTKETTTQEEETTVVTTSIEQAYKGTIVIKDTYIFVDGVEVEGISGLQASIRYTEASETAYKIINDNANGDFLNNEILPILYKMGFYGEQTEVKHVMSETPLKHIEATTQATTVEDTTIE